MISNYIKIALRSLARNKTFSFINIFGLATGLACCLLIAAYLYGELSYDRYSANANRIYRVEIQNSDNGHVDYYPNVDVAVGEGLKKTFPGIIASTRVQRGGDLFIKYGDKQFKEQQVAICDSDFLQVFSIPLLTGDPKTALVEPNSMVITSAFAKKYFGEEPALGKMLTIGTRVFKVTGMIDKVPENSHFHFDAFMSATSYSGLANGTTWSNIGPYTYLLLDKNTDAKKLEARFPEAVAKYVVPEVVHDMGVSLAEAQKSVNTFIFKLRPLTDIHLYSHTSGEIEASGDINYVYIFGALALFILLLACVNFTNLSTASSDKRSREVGIRKVLGSVNRQLISQFLVESILLTFFAMLIAFGIVFLLLPYFNQLSGKQVEMGFFLTLPAIVVTIALVLLVGLLAGIYPAFFLSSFKILRVLKGSSSAPMKKSRLRNGLVVFQFAISTALIIATFIVYQQLHFMQNKKLGYDKEQMLVIKDAYALRANQEPFQQRLMQDSRVVISTISWTIPGDATDGTQAFAKENKSNESQAEIHTSIFHVDYNFLATLNMQLVAGRFFSKEFAADSSKTVVNEAAVREYGWKGNEDALGKTIVRSGQKEFTVIGVVKDFHYASIKQKIDPAMMLLGNNYGSLIVKLRTADIQGLLGNIKNYWNDFNPSRPLDYYFLDDHFASLYRAEEKTGQISTVFAVIAVLIASLGLFGLAAFTAEQRTREIGIRKVLGASVQGILFMLSRQFLILVLVAFVVSVPITWWAMHAWLQDFAYRVNVSWWVFLVSGALALVVAMLTISAQALKAALANPVKSLRSE